MSGTMTVCLLVLLCVPMLYRVGLPSCWRPSVSSAIDLDEPVARVIPGAVCPTCHAWAAQCAWPTAPAAPRGNARAAPCGSPREVSGLGRRAGRPGASSIEFSASPASLGFSQKPPREAGFEAGLKPTEPVFEGRLQPASHPEKRLSSSKFICFSARLHSASLGFIVAG